MDTIWPALNRGCWVVSDRFADASEDAFWEAYGEAKTTWKEKMFFTAAALTATHRDPETVRRS